MTRRSTPPTPGGLMRVFRDIQNLRYQRVSSAGLNPQMALLRTWQSQRLARTYADLLADPRYRRACQFFLNDLYAPRDFSQRDHDILQMYDFMQRVFSEALIRPLKLTVEVNLLTEALDERLLDVLVNQLGLTEAITEQLYAEAYRRCDNYADRVRQIDLVYKIGQELDGIVQMPLTAAALTLAKVPARQAGYVELADFIERGYSAFKHMRGADHFLKTVRQRERRILDRIYGEEPEPFAI